METREGQAHEVAELGIEHRACFLPSFLFPFFPSNGIADDLLIHIQTLLESHQVVFLKNI